MVFTGIVEEKGEVVSMELKPNQKMWDGTISDGWVLKVGDMKLGLEDVKMGCSIAINGVCLTVTDWNVKEQWATFGISPETRKLTNLRDCKPGDKVNVERAAKLDDRNSGHYVQGHVNGTCTIKEKYEDGDSLRIRFEVLEAKILRGITHKGYIALDGTSLTVTEVDYGAKFFAVMLVPHTRSIICFPSKPIGANVNVELDIRAAAQKVQEDLLRSTEEKLQTMKMASGILCVGMLALGAGIGYVSSGQRSSLLFQQANEL